MSQYYNFVIYWLQTCNNNNKLLYSQKITWFKQYKGLILLYNKLIFNLEKFQLKNYYFNLSEWNVSCVTVCDDIILTEDGCSECNYKHGWSKAHSWILTGDIDAEGLPEWECKGQWKNVFYVRIQEIFLESPEVTDLQMETGTTMLDTRRF